jgi:hypothetical protein
MKKDSRDGSYFIDRDGTGFHHVLNYLRKDGTFVCPRDVVALVALREEARFYVLPGLEDCVSTAIAGVHKLDAGR